MTSNLVDRIYMFVKRFDDFVCYVMSADGVDYVLIGEMHGAKTYDEPTGDSFAKILKDLINRCDKPVDVFIEDEYRMRFQYVHRDVGQHITHGQQTTMNAVRLVARGEGVKPCKIVRTHVVDMRVTQQVESVLGILDNLEAIAYENQPKGSTSMPLRGNRQEQELKNTEKRICYIANWTMAMYESIVVNAFDFTLQKIGKAINKHHSGNMAIKLQELVKNIRVKLSNEMPCIDEKHLRACFNKCANVYTHYFQQHTMLVDLYTVVRITRPDFSNMRIFYGGFEHANTIRRILLAAGLKESQTSYPPSASSTTSTLSSS